jgi:DNA polymerase-3 subunit alpha
VLGCRFGRRLRAGNLRLDPLRYALLFQRFPNPERVSMPELDIDFCEDNRWRLIEYIRQKCGADAVSQIVTFLHHVFEKPSFAMSGGCVTCHTNFCDQFSKLIPVEINKPLSLVRGDRGRATAEGKNRAGGRGARAV